MKNPRKKLWLAISIIIAVAAALQLSSGFEFFGVRPNLVLVVALVATFFIEGFLPYAALVLIGTIFLRFEPGFNADLLILGLICLLAFWIRRNFVLPSFITSLGFICAGSLGFYLLTAPSFLISQPGEFFIELAYNILVGMVLFVILAWLRRRWERN